MADRSRLRFPFRLRLPLRLVVPGEPRFAPPLDPARRLSTSPPFGWAAASVPLNLSEGRRRHGRDRLHLWRVAAGSAGEVVACLRVAQAWGHLDAPSTAPALALCDRVLAMLWRLTH